MPSLATTFILSPHPTPVNKASKLQTSSACGYVLCIRCRVLTSLFAFLSSGESAKRGNLQNPCRFAPAASKYPASPSSLSTIVSYTGIFVILFRQSPLRSSCPQTLKKIKASVGIFLLLTKRLTAIASSSPPTSAAPVVLTKRRNDPKIRSATPKSLRFFSYWGRFRNGTPFPRNKTTQGRHGKLQPLVQDVLPETTSPGSLGTIHVQLVRRFGGLFAWFGRAICALARQYTHQRETDITRAHDSLRGSN